MILMESVPERTKVMQIIHPQGMYNGLNPEDVFIVVDDMGAELGQGYIIYQFQPHMDPDCPLNLYFSINCQPVARYLLFGALVARARQLRDFKPGVPARVYTHLAPNDSRMRECYAHNGFRCTDTENLLVLEKPAHGSRMPMSCAVTPVSLRTMEEQAALIARMHMNDLTYVTQESLASLMSMPHFLALALYRNTDIIGEILMSGQGDSCELNAMYVDQANRRQGMGTFLVHRAMDILAAEGVTHFTTRIMSHSQPQCRLMERFNAVSQGVFSVHPSLPL